MWANANGQIPLFWKNSAQATLPTPMGGDRMRLTEQARLMESAHSGQFDAWVTRSAAAEAQDLYRMVRFGNCTITSIRELISVPPSIENVLMAYAHSHPEDAGRIARVLRFREEVRKE